MSFKNKKQFVSRVNQIDAIYLTEDIYKHFKDNLFENIQIISPYLYSICKPELDLIVNSALWVGSIGCQFSTFGQKLLMLSYDTSSLSQSKLCLHCLLSIIPTYVRNVSEHRFLNKMWLKKIVMYGENISMVTSFLIFFKFLKTGKRPSFIDSLLQLDIKSLRSNQRNVGYKYMTRELIWGGFMELIGMVLPLLNVHKIQRILSSTIGNNANIRNNDSKECTFNATSLCSYCLERPTLPHHMGCCSSVYCYYCLQGKIDTDNEFSCITCGSTFSKIYPLC